MKLNILLFFMSFTLIGSMGAQNLSFSVSPVFVYDVTEADFEGVGHSLLRNTADVTRNFRWDMTVVEMESTWDVVLCDKNLCHEVGVFTAEFSLDPGESGTMDVHALTNFREGYGIVEVTVTDLADESLNISNLYYFNADPTSTKEITTQSIKVYPNPSNGLFSVKGDKGIAQVEVFSLAGTKVKSFTYGDGQWYDISDMPRGTYLVRLVDRSGQQLVTKLMNRL